MKTKFGFNGIAFKVNDFIEQGIAAENAGFTSMWVADHFTDVPPPYEMYEPWTILSAIGAKTDRILLGTSATDCVRRHPASLAHTLVTLDNLTKGRTILGIGAGEAMNIKPYDMPWEDPTTRLERLAETIEVMRLLWSSSYDNPVTYRGRFYRLANARLDLRPYDNRRIPIFVASLGSKKALELVGRIGDGWLPWFNTPETFADRSKIIEESARKFGRSGEDIEKAAIAYFIMTDDPDKQKALIGSVKPEIVIHTSAQRLDSMGYKVRVNKSANYSFQRCIASREDGVRARELGEQLPDEIARNFVVAGSPKQCIAQFEALVEAGARHIIIRDILWANDRRDFKTTINGIADDIISVFS